MTPTLILAGQFTVVVLGVVLTWVVAARRLPAPWSAIGWGMLAFPLSQVARYALVIPLTVLMEARFGAWAATATIVLMVLTSGIFEETARWIVLRFWAKRTRTWEHGVAFGLGHGGIEAILITGLAAVNGVILVATADTARAAVEASAPDQVPAFEQQLTALESLTVGMASVGIYERVLAIIVHVAMTLLVLRAVRTGRWQWWLAAVVAHCAVNAAAVLAMTMAGGDQQTTMLVTEGALTVIAAILLWALLRGPLSRRRGFIRDDAPTTTAAPNVVPPDAATS